MADHRPPFIFPIHLQDIELRKQDRYYVKDIANVAEMHHTEQKQFIQDHLTSMISYDVICTHFDGLYSILKSFEALEFELQQKWIEGLISIFNEIGQEVLAAAPASVHSITSSSQQGLKMILFLLCHGLMQCCRSQCSSEQQVLSATGKKKSKSKTKSDSNAFEVVQQGIEIFEIFLTKVSTASSVVEEEMLQLLMKMTFETWKVSRFMKNKEFTLQSITLLLLLSNDHVSTIAAESVALLLKRQTFSSSSTILLEIITEIGNQTTSRDTAGAKQLASFLSHLATLIPKDFLANITQFLPLLNHESYALRNAMITSTGSIILATKTRPASNNTGSSDDDSAVVRSDVAMEKTRETLLSVIAERIHDINGFVRNQVLKTWIELAQAQAIPLSCYQLVTHCAVDRIQDRNVHVRKNAISLLVKLIEQNPFLNVLNRRLFQKKMDEIIQAQVKGKPSDANSTTNDDDDSLDDDLVESFDQQCHVDDDPSVEDSTTATTEEDREQEKDEIHQRVVDFYSAGLSFIIEIESMFPHLPILLNSKTLSDVQETCTLIVRLNQFRFHEAEHYFRNLLSLIWRSEPLVKDHVRECFQQWFVHSSTSSNERMHVFFQFFDHMTFAEWTSMEEIVATIPPPGDPDSEENNPKTLFTAAFCADIVALILNKKGGTSAGIRRKALQLLCLFFNQPASVRCFIENIPESKQRQVFHHGMTSFHQDLYGLKLTCVLCQRIVQVYPLPHQQQVPNTETYNHDPQHLLQLQHQQRKWIVAFLINSVKGGGASEKSENSDHPKQQVDLSLWFNAAEQSLATLFDLSPHPDHECQDVLIQLTHHILGTDASQHSKLSMSNVSTLDDVRKENQLAQLLFLVGHVAMLMLRHIERIGNMWKKVHQKTLTTRKTLASKTSKVEEEEDELGTSAAEIEAEEDALLTQMSSHELVESKSNLLQLFGPIISQLVKSHSTSSFVLAETSTLSLCKFMCISAEYCERHLPLLFTTLHRVHEPSIRSNVMIALGDLSFRFPNLIEPWTDYIYERLQDPDVLVRRNTLMVLTHLILNDMIKVKGKVHLLVLTLKDEDDQIGHLTHTLFHELSLRVSNPIYNLFPDMLSALSQLVHGSGSSDVRLTREEFQSMVTFVLTLIQKEKQFESLVDKLCLRFCGSNSSTSEWTDLAYCLCALSNWSTNERMMTRLLAQVKYWKHAVVEDPVYEHFQSIVAKCQKLLNAKPEARTTWEELSRELERCRGLEELLDDEEEEEEPSTLTKELEEEEPVVP